MHPHLYFAFGQFSPKSKVTVLGLLALQSFVCAEIFVEGARCPQRSKNITLSRLPLFYAPPPYPKNFFLRSTRNFVGSFFIAKQDFFEKFIKIFFPSLLPPPPPSSPLFPPLPCSTYCIPAFPFITASAFSISILLSPSHFLPAFLANSPKYEVLDSGLVR